MGYTGLVSVVTATVKHRSSSNCVCVCVCVCGCGCGCVGVLKHPLTDGAQFAVEIVVILPSKCLYC